MNIKKFFVVMSAVALSLNASAQSWEEGAKMYNYQRYSTAKNMLAPMAEKDPMANYYLGLAELELGNVDAAKALFSKYPENNANISGLIRVAFLKGDAAGAMQMAKNLADKTKRKQWEPLKYAADAVTYGVAKGKGGDIQQAINWYKDALAVNDNAELLVAMGDANLLVSTNSGVAVTSYEKAVEKDPKNSLAHSRMGKTWYEAKNYKLALESYEKAKQSDPSNPLPYCALADAYSYVGNYDSSKQNLEKCLELSDKSVDDVIKYAGVLFLNKEYAPAAQKVEELLRQGNSKAGLYGILGASQYELGDSANKYGLENYRKYITNQDPSKVTSGDYRTLAKMLLKNDMGTEANTYLEKAIAKDASTNKADAYRQNAEAMREAREWVLAASWYKKLADEYPEDAKAIDYFYWGVCNYYGHEYAGARMAFEQMETKFPDQPSATYWRGRTEAAIDSNAKEGLAVPHYTKWLQLNTEKKTPDLKQAYQYMIIYYYNTEDKANMSKYMEEMRKIDPKDGLLKQVEEATKSSAKKAK